jgi:hypothetical protein
VILESVVMMRVLIQISNQQSAIKNQQSTIQESYENEIELVDSDRGPGSSDRRARLGVRNARFRTH